jgi:hypothetical protein
MEKKPQAPSHKNKMLQFNFISEFSSAENENMASLFIEIKTT